METKSKQVTLWPFFTLELLSLVIWARIAALSSMGYTPSFNWSNVLLIVFYLYPAFIFVAVPTAFLLRNSGKVSAAITVAILPPIISCFCIFLLILLAR